MRALPNSIQPRRFPNTRDGSIDRLVWELSGLRTPGDRRDFMLITADGMGGASAHGTYDIETMQCMAATVLHALRNAAENCGRSDVAENAAEALVWLGFGEPESDVLIRPREG